VRARKTLVGLDESTSSIQADSIHPLNITDPKGTDKLRLMAFGAQGGCTLRKYVGTLYTAIMPKIEMSCLDHVTQKINRLKYICIGVGRPGHSKYPS
jgi:hypothetical protein